MIHRNISRLVGAVAALACAAPLGAAITTEVSLGNLFDDAAGTDIATAVASDTFSASAQTSDLGVEIVIDNANQLALNTAQTIAPSVSFDLASAGGGTAFPRNIFNDAWQPSSPIRTTGSAAPALVNGAKVEDGIGTHANALITFNLDELRAAGTPGYASVFRAYYDQNDDQAASGAHRAVVIVSDASGNVLAGYVNGQAVAVTESGGVWSFTGAMPGEHAGSAASGLNLAVGLPSNAAYITLASTSTNVTSDHAAWSGARIDYDPKISLGNLFDDTRPGTLTGTELWAGLDTDTYKATAGNDDLGVDIANGGGLGSDIAINSGGVLFNFVNVGGDDIASEGIGNDAVGGTIDTRPPLRLDGDGSGFPASGAGWNSKVEDGIGIHANRFVTFDLDEIREAGGLGDAAFRFTTLAGLNDSAFVGGSTNGIRAIVLLSDDDGVVAGFVNGVEVALTESGGVWSFTGVIPGQFTTSTSTASAMFDMVAGSGVRYLTLVATGTSNINTDHVAFIDANLTTLVPAPAALPAGLMLIGLAAARRRRGDR